MQDVLAVRSKYLHKQYNKKGNRFVGFLFFAFLRFVILKNNCTFVG